MENRKPKSTGRDYELYVLTLIEDVFQALFGPKAKSVKFRHNVRLEGTAGIKYQIDILGETAHKLFVIECKDQAVELDHKVTTAFISKCVDIANHHPKKTVYGVIINTRGYYPTAVSSKKRKIWNTSHINLQRQIKLLRLAFEDDQPFAVAYEFDSLDIRHIPLLSDNSRISTLDERLSYLQTGEDLGLRISVGFHLLQQLNGPWGHYSQDVKQELQLVAFENISNSFLHLSRYFDADFFSKALLQLDLRKHVDSYYEGHLISTIVRYKKAQTIGTLRPIRPARNKVHQLRRLIEPEGGLSKSQSVSCKLFLGLWIARHEDHTSGLEMIEECQRISGREEFRDSRWHQCVALLRKGELARNEDLSIEALKQANTLIPTLCAKHSAVGRKYFAKISAYRKNLREDQCNYSEL